MDDHLPEGMRRYKLLTGLLTLALLLWVVYGVAVWRAFPADGPISRGIFGDMFGGINALFTAFAFAGLLYTIALQRDEIGLQLRELNDTRQEFQRQTETFRKQNFESTFFQLVGLHHQLVQSQSASFHPSATYTQRSAFSQAARELAGRLLTGVRHAPHKKQWFLEQHFRQTCLSPDADFGHYFRNVYHIVKFVDNSGVSDPSFYTSILRAQLSADELTLVFYNCLHPVGAKFKLLVEKYALLEQMRHDEASQLFDDGYAMEAFGDNPPA